MAEAAGFESFHESKRAAPIGRLGAYLRLAEGMVRGRSAGDRREPTREGRAPAWEGVTGTATNGSQPLPGLKTTDFLQLTTLHNS